MFHNEEGTKSSVRLSICKYNSAATVRDLNLQYDTVNKYGTLQLLRFSADNFRVDVSGDSRFSKPTYTSHITFIFITS